MCFAIPKSRCKIEIFRRMISQQNSRKALFICTVSSQSAKNLITLCTKIVKLYKNLSKISTSPFCKVLSQSHMKFRLNNLTACSFMIKLDCLGYTMIKNSNDNKNNECINYIGFNFHLSDPTLSNPRATCWWILRLNSSS